MITFGALYAAFRGLRKKASAGVDGVTYEEYERDVAGNLQTLHERLESGKYQAQPLRRVYIPKENGKQRPISIPALEDKIVQKAMVEILNAIYDQNFLDCSYGFRPGRGQHQALDEVRRVICTRPTECILEIDITAYFDSIVRTQLMEMIEKRVRDGSVLRLIRKWIQVGVIEDGRLLVSETGTGQGQTVSPLLAQDIGLFSARNPDLFDLHFWSDLFEIILEQFLFELLELAAWRAHQILSAAFAYGYQVLFTHHSAVKDPYSPCFSMLTLHRAQDRFDSGNIGAISIE
jgi:Reverse transcriptase (RNA-dependent DNA polymerase)